MTCFSGNFITEKLNQKPLHPKRGEISMPEKLLNISQAKQFLDARQVYWCMYPGSGDEIWVDEPEHITSLMVVKEANRRPYIDTDANIFFELDSKEALLDLLSILEPAKSYYATLHREWMWPIFENELNAIFHAKQYGYIVERADFTPRIRHPVRELEADDVALIDTIPDEDNRDLTHRQFKVHTKSFCIVEANQLVSYTCAHGGSGEEREIDWIYTRPDKRRKGYGTSVASVAAEYMFQTGAKKVSATADWYNIGSLRIWEKLVFRREEAVTSYIFRTT